MPANEASKIKDCALCSAQHARIEAACPRMSTTACTAQQSTAGQLTVQPDDVGRNGRLHNGEAVGHDPVNSTEQVVGW